MVNDQGLNNDIDQPEALDDRLFQLGLDQSLLFDQLSLPGVQLITNIFRIFLWKSNTE